MLFFMPLTINASYERGVVKSTKGDGINLRKGPGTSYERVDGLNDGKVVTIVSLENTDDATTACNSWYKILYNDSYAYACSDFIILIEIKENADYDFDLELSKFPESYKPYILKLHEIYPNALFYAENTSLNDGNIIDFSVAVSNENILGKSLIWDTYPNNTRDGLKSLESFIFDINGFRNTYSGGGVNWYAASGDTIAYYMDPRNFLNEERVFMFEKESYDPAIHVISGVDAILKGSYMENAYVDNSNITFSQAIMDAATISNVSPYFLAGRILQEVGTTRSGLVKGVYENYPQFNGYYNYYNIKATGDAIVYNGLLYAYNNGWNSEYKAIVEGSKWVGKNYINDGQDTEYYQKWDVKCSGSSSCFNHQYMQNIEAPYHEALKKYNAYLKNIDTMYINPYVFVIPIYNNLPDKTELPSTQSNVNFLSNISINGNVLQDFNPNQLDYEVTVYASKISLEATSYGAANIEGIGLIDIKDKDVVTIKVTSLSGSIKNYTVKFNVLDNKDEMTLEETINNIKSGRFKDNYLFGITNVDTLKKIIFDSNYNAIVTIKDNSGNIVTTGSLATGYKVSITVLSSTKEYDIVIVGDTNGDSDITVLDLLRVQKQLLNSINLTGAYYEASDVNKDSKVDVLDLLLIRKHLLKTSEIVQ